MRRRWLWLALALALLATSPVLGQPTAVTILNTYDACAANEAQLVRNGTDTANICQALAAAAFVDVGDDGGVDNDLAEVATTQDHATTKIATEPSAGKFLLNFSVPYTVIDGGIAAGVTRQADKTDMQIRRNSADCSTQTDGLDGELCWDVTDDDLYICDNAAGCNAANWVNLTAGGGAHALLSATHSDTLAGTVTRGDIVIGNATPAWAELAIGTVNQVLATDGTDPAWTTLADAHIPDTHSHAAGSIADDDLAAGAVDGGSGGEIADGTVDSNDLATANKTTATRFLLADPDPAAVNYVLPLPPYTGTMTEIRCQCYGGTNLVVNFCDGEDYADDTCTTSIPGANMTCTATGSWVTDSTLSATGFVAYDEVSLVVVSESGSVDRCAFVITHTID